MTAKLACMEQQQAELVAQLRAELRECQAAKAAEVGQLKEQLAEIAEQLRQCQRIVVELKAEVHHLRAGQVSSAESSNDVEVPAAPSAPQPAAAEVAHAHAAAAAAAPQQAAGGAGEAPASGPAAGAHALQAAAALALAGAGSDEGADLANLMEGSHISETPPSSEAPTHISNTVLSGAVGPQLAAVQPFKPAAAAANRRRRPLRPCAALSVDQQPPAAASRDLSHETDVVIIGSGIGGLCCAALLARYGYSVTVLESHYLAGGAAHSFEIQGYSCDAGPSFFAGLSGPPGSSKTNPLKLVLDAVGESVECVTYNKWIVYQPNGRSFECVCDADAYAENIRREGGEEAYRQWKELEQLMQPLQEGAAMLPAAALRADPGIALTAGRFGPGLLKAGLVAGQLTAPFSALVDKAVTNPWLRSFLDLECFILSGMTAKDTICAEMAFMFGERHSGETTIDYPVGGSKAIVDALVRGIEKHGGRVLLRSHVEQVLVEGGRAAGVRLRGSGGSSGRPEVVRARRAVVSNASVWDTMRLLPDGTVPDDYRRQCMDTHRTGSFVHLHLGIDATGLPPDLECHYLLPNQWGNFEAPQNVINVSIPTVFDPSLAPPGKHLIHAYTAGNEPYEVWEGVRRGTPEYAALKEERSQCLWAALEKIIPDVRLRAELVLVGTPLTHERFLRRYKGTYGPAISAADGSFPGPGTPLPGLLRCGDSCAPGIGVPAAAASGMIAANTLAPVWSHWQLLDALGL
ncbi:ABC transporter A family member 7-like isoform B [Chlorella sorokiniana]|uniref:ABC transporter A family member 7-like isoform B n=1 Tax=Chlorella sorokiniana TaxID=3076 RepID=A0A2P6TJN2_CHLSO|nr:ABC transporter A family member 7-like isoform B [Chlorella sorokiniana]|eukprot:PRW44291.1 ABC transporter A family member 7-like isoform B [Chlorella sorokiniana]